jgi:hypothetical protein
MFTFACFDRCEVRRREESCTQFRRQVPKTFNKLSFSVISKVQITVTFVSL